MSGAERSAITGTDAGIPSTTGVASVTFTGAQTGIVVAGSGWQASFHQKRTRHQLIASGERSSTRKSLFL
jgi:hypothetical protein